MSDVFLYNAEIARGLDLQFIEIIHQEKQSSDCTVVLVSNGGDPDAAYKIGRYIQDRYESFEVLLPGICKSAGTLLAISAKALVFTPYGELGPLDIQLVKEDKLGALQSGLNISEAFTAIEDRAKDTYHKLVGEILTASNGVVSIRTALHAATEMISALYGPIFKQIDPEEVGSRSRAMRIAEEYTERLNSKWQNLRSRQSIDILARAYPRHEFVIDHVEAASLFKRVRIASDEEMRIVEGLGPLARFPDSEPHIRYIDEDEKSSTGAKDHDPASTGKSRRETRARRKPKADGQDIAAPS